MFIGSSLTAQSFKVNYKGPTSYQRFSTGVLIQLGNVYANIEYVDTIITTISEKSCITFQNQGCEVFGYYVESYDDFDLFEGCSDDENVVIRLYSDRIEIYNVWFDYQALYFLP